jgi:hypothetical protein
MDVLWVIANAFLMAQTAIQIFVHALAVKIQTII